MGQGALFLRQGRGDGNGMPPKLRAIANRPGRGFTRMPVELNLRCRGKRRDRFGGRRRGRLQGILAGLGIQRGCTRDGV